MYLMQFKFEALISRSYAARDKGELDAELRMEEGP